MKTMSMPFLRIDTTLLAASLVSLLIGMGLTLSIVLGTHHFERIRAIPIVSDIPSGYQLPRTDEETYYRRLSSPSIVATTVDDLPRTDEETFYRQTPVSALVISGDSMLPRADEETL